MGIESMGMALLGGAMIGLAAGLLLLFNGRIAGITGILSGALVLTTGDWIWRAVFAAGLLAGGGVVYAIDPGAFAFQIERTLPLMALGGLLVGFGSRLGSGCTSGHGVCGIGRLSLRSVVATATFTLTGFASVYVLNHLL
jgi:hypothetical protein